MTGWARIGFYEARATRAGVPMNDVVLTAAEHARLVKMISALFGGTPGDEEAWGNVVAESLNDLLGAGAALLVLQRGAATRIYGDRLPSTIASRYATAPTELSAGGLLPGTRVWCRAAPPADAVILPGDLSLGATLPDGEYEAVGFTTEFGIPGTYARAACQLRPPGDAVETRRCLALLDLVLPAFAAAARARAFAAVPRAAMARLTDALDTGALLCSTTGEPMSGLDVRSLEPQQLMASRGW